MKPFLGVWRGTGVAVYPTIETTQYRDELTFREHEGKPIVQVEQKTWRIHPDQTETLLHWEFGFVRQVADTTYEWVNAQNNGRVEVLKGELSGSAGAWVLDLRSAAFANDPRMLQSIRHFQIEGDQLRYTMTMATQAHPALEVHLQAELRRV